MTSYDIRNRFRLLPHPESGMVTVYKRLDGRFDAEGIALGLPASTLFGKDRIDVLYESARIAEFPGIDR